LFVFCLKERLFLNLATSSGPSQPHVLPIWCIGVEITERQTANTATNNGKQWLAATAAYRGMQHGGGQVTSQPAELPLPHGSCHLLAENNTQACYNTDTPAR